VFSLEVPKTSQELLEGLIAFIPFGFCFATVFYAWFQQYKFFRRYGMNDQLTIMINGVLIFIVLFAVYPLKFLFSSLLLDGGYSIREQDVLPLTIVYNGGIAGIYTVLGLMYVNAYTKRKELKLSPIEIFETRSHIYTFFYITSVGVIIIVAALLLGKQAAAATGGWGLMGFMGVFKAYRNKQFKKKFGNAKMVEPHLAEEIDL